MRATKEVIKQRGHLLAIDDKEVRVGFPSWQLLQRAHEKQHLPILKATVKNHWGNQMKARLVVSGKRHQ
jgi:hypothetical protein